MTDQIEPTRDRFSIAPGLSVLLDCARWTSAFMVLLTHVNNRVTVRLGGNVAGAHIAQLAWGFICGFGHHAVVVFFVLSGFLVGSRVIRDIVNDMGDFGSYLIARVSRIHLALIPALILTLVLDSIGSHLVPFIYSGSHQGSFIGNVFMMQGFLTESFRSDGPLGTLANEFWYYITFYLLAVGLWRRQVILQIVAAALLIPMGLHQPWHAIGFGLWLIGAIAGSVSIRAVSPAIQKTLLVAFLVMLLTLRLGIRLEQYTPLVTAVTDTAVASAFGLVLYAFRTNDTFKLGRFKKANETLASFSYSLYVIHAPVVMMLCAISVLLTGFGWKSAIVAPWQWVIIGLLIITPVISAYLFSRCTESHTSKVRRLLDQARLRISAALHKRNGHIDAAAPPASTTQNSKDGDRSAPGRA